MNNFVPLRLCERKTEPVVTGQSRCIGTDYHKLIFAMKNPFRFLRLPAIFALGLLALGSHAETVRNVVVITTDDQGPQAGCYGDPHAVTPNLDALAAAGTLFERGYTTQASCSPARASLLTGLYPHQNGQVGLAGHHPEFRVKPGLPNLPALFQEAGFATGILGKLHVSPARDFPFDFEWASHGNPKLTRDVREVAARAGEFLDGTDGRRFFLYVNYFDPHRPFDDGMRQTEGLPEDPYAAAEVPPLPYLGIDGPGARAEAAAYYNGIKRMDVGLGLLFAALKERGFWKDTLIVFVGDHGPPFTRGKTTVYEAGEQIPYIVRWPGVGDAGQRSDALVSMVDIFPTVLDATGLAVTPNAGRSLRPVLDGALPADWRTFLFTEYTAHAADHFYPRRAVRTERFKLIHNLDHQRPNPVPYIGATRRAPPNRTNPDFVPAYKRMERPPEFEFFDLHQDPYELSNVADDPTYAEPLAELKEALHAWRVATGDPLLEPAELERLREAVVREEDR